MLVATAAATILAPLVIPAVVVYDVATGRARLPSPRAALFVCQYLLNDSVEILAAPLLWVAGGLGTRLDTDTSIRRHERLQRWSVGVMARRADRLLGVRLDWDEDVTAALEPGPLIVCCRHVSLLDSSLPSVLYGGRDVHLRGVIMAEMLADPGFDLLYGRLGSVFIPRDNAPEAYVAVAAMGATLDERSVAVIFPEGRLFRPELLERALQRLADRDPERAARLSGLHHVLPPRPGGFNALLDAAPTADVVIIAHAGLDPYQRFVELARNVPLPDPVRVTAWRTSRDEVPPDPVGRAEWLDAQWCRVDDWIDGELNAIGPPARTQGDDAVLGTSKDGHDWRSSDG
jgi:1-acyl-sn-glycerol-3-phosphate acyltransferase